MTIAEGHPPLPEEETGKSEDVGILDSRSTKYVKFQSEIRKVILEEGADLSGYVEGVVDHFFRIENTPWWSILISVGGVAIKNYLRRRKLRSVIENILRKTFDVTLDWYVMDYEDLRRTCDYLAGKDYFTREDHGQIYGAVIQKLMQGPVRDKCVQLGIVDFLNDKLADIRESYREFRIKEM